MTRRTIGTALIASALCIATPSAFADGGPPKVRDCEAEIPASEFNDRIDCKVENANAAMFDYVDAAIELDRLLRDHGEDPIFSDAQMDHLTNARERAQAARARSHEAEAFRASARRQKPQDADCYVKEIVGDGKGDDVQPCRMNEDCEEVLGDGIGDDDGVCKVRGNPNQREVCVEVCQQPLLDDDDEYDPTAAADTEAGLDEIERTVQDGTDEVKATIARARAHFATRPPRGGMDCNQYEFGLFPGSGALQATQIVKNTTSAAFNACSVACNQDVFGWNCEAACVVFAVIDGIAQAVNDGFSVRDGANGSAQLDRVAMCTTRLSEDLGSVSESVGNTEAALEDVQAKLDDLAEQVEELMKFVESRFLTVEDHLCTPQGARECFPDGASNGNATRERRERTRR